jgi:hypothetical protein
MDDPTVLLPASDRPPNSGSIELLMRLCGDCVFPFSRRDDLERAISQRPPKLESLFGQRNPFRFSIAR